MIPLAAVVVAFTLSNRTTVMIDLWPAPYSFQVPVFATVLAAVFFGFLCGAIVSFISAGRRRARNRQLMRMLENSRREQAYLMEQVKKLEASIAAGKTTTQIPGNTQTPLLTRVDAA